MTKWIYQDSTGSLTQKQDAALRSLNYTYDEVGRLKTRVWARGITCTYAYDPNTGELAGVSYSDSTPGVTFAYDRGGRQKTITDVAGTRDRSFNAAGDLQTEQITGGVLDGLSTTIGFDSFLRRNSLQSSQSANTLTNQTYGYDTSSRLQTATSGSQTATYSYYPASGSLNTTTFTGGTNVVRTYDTIGRLQNITTTPASESWQGYTYTYNNLNQRTRVTREDASYWSYVYNDRGEIVSAKKFWSDNSIVWGAQTEYAYDNIGNRISTKSGGNLLNQLRQSSYTPNSVNQYTQRTNPGAVDIMGTANSSATVSVNDQGTSRKSNYFYKELPVDNSMGPVNQQVNVVGARQNFAVGGEDAVTQQGGRVFVPSGLESFTCDFDGNLISDGRWSYAWDAENRLVSMGSMPAVPVDAKQKLDFAYDAIGRRIQKRVYAWNVGTGTYDLQSTVKFVYDGWSLIAEIDGNGNLLRSYAWGDGKLLLIASGGGVYQVGLDGNENVGLLVKTSTGTIAGSYDYDSFGQTLKATGEFASQNPFRFSEQYTDLETGFAYYGHRYYNPQTGRWTTRDSSGEDSGTNLYSFLVNDGVNSTDLLGLWKAEGDWSGGWRKYSGIAVADKCDDNLGRLAYLITGYESDWHALNRPSDKVRKDERVNIAPLLVLLENRLRNKTLAAAVSYNTVWGDFSAGTKPTASLINQYFGKNSFGHSDCAQGLELVYGKAMVDVFGADEWNKWDLDLIEQIPQLLTDKPGGGTPGDMWLGDSGFIQNYPGYLELSRRANPRGEPGASQGENIIKVGASRFWGYTGRSFGRDTRPINQWQDMLRSDYNAVSGRSGPADQYPRFSGRISFVDTAKLARWAFDDRNK